MRLETSDGRPLWLAYGMNVHPGGEVQTTLDAIKSTVLPLKRRLGVKGPFGLAVRWSAAGIEQLLRYPAWLNVLRETLRANDLRVFTGNAFVFGDFHGKPLKASVYSPTWRETKRVEYTLGFAEVLAALNEPGTQVSLSTSPPSWRGWGWNATEARLCAEKLVACAEGLRSIEERTGVRPTLAIEPEPGCALERTEEVLAFFRGPLAQELDGSAHLEPYLGVCYDVCHQAVEWEDVGENLDALGGAGIRVAKLQASCALELSDPTCAEGRAALARFDEPVYLHQVGAQDAEGAVHVAADLGDVLEDPSWQARGPWRVHFHVPVFREEAVPPLRTTRPVLDVALERLARDAFTEHVEIETYTWDVLPDAERAAGTGSNLVDALARETEYVLGRLEAQGVRRLDASGT